MHTSHATEPATEFVQAPLALEAQFRSGANWFFWIAGMSLVNSLVGLFGGQWGFVIGLGVTQVIDGMLTLGDGSTASRLVGPLLTAAVAAIFIAFGYFAREGGARPSSRASCSTCWTRSCSCSFVTCSPSRCTPSRSTAW